jgi:translation initiation factor 6 (eIF-6)
MDSIKELFVQKQKLSKINSELNVRIVFKTQVDGNITIGNNTYINSYGRLVTGRQCEI